MRLPPFFPALFLTVFIVLPAQAQARLDRSTFEPRINPCNDFYAYVCGGWAKKAGARLDRDLLSWSQAAAERANHAALDALLNGKTDAADPEVRHLQNFFRSCMASGPKVERIARAELRQWLGEIDGLKTKAEFDTQFIRLQVRGFHPFFRYSGEPDANDKSRYRGEIHQAAFGLSRTAYLSPSKAALARYRDHVARMFVLSGLPAPQAAQDAARLVEMETVLAKAAISFSDRFDSRIGSNPLPPAELTRRFPAIPWNPFLKLVKHPAEKTVNVTAPRYLAAVNDILAGQKLAGLRAYLRWQVLKVVLPALPGPLRDENARFVKASRGLEPSSRYDVCLLSTVKAMGIELSRQFSHRFVGRDARDIAKQDAERLRRGALAMLDRSDWLSPSARKHSADKIAALDTKIGFPDTWPAAADFPVRPDNFLRNMLAANRFEEERGWKRAHLPRTRQSWDITVYPNGAPGPAVARLIIPFGYSDIFSNSIIVPAASLYPPLFDAHAPLEIRMATFGALIGHELVHVLEAHSFDAQGERRELWSKADSVAHDRRAMCLADRAAKFSSAGTGVDGKLVRHEHVADMAGLALAYRATENELGSRLKEKDRDGFTRAQRFFIAYAQKTCAVQTPQSARTDSHGPPQLRVNAVVANMPAFARAFQCKANAPMARPSEALCKVW